MTGFTGPNQILLDQNKTNKKKQYFVKLYFNNWTCLISVKVIEKWQDFHFLVHVIRFLFLSNCSQSRPFFHSSLNLLGWDFFLFASYCLIFSFFSYVAIFLPLRDSPMIAPFIKWKPTQGYNSVLKGATETQWIFALVPNV